MHESSGDFGPCPAPAWVPWMLLKMSLLLSFSKTRPRQSHGKGFSSPGEQSWGHFPRDAGAEQRLQEAPPGLDFAQHSFLEGPLDE